MSLASYRVPYNISPSISKDKSENNKDNKSWNKSSNNLNLSLNINNVYRKKEYKTFVTLAKERKFKIYFNKKGKSQNDQNEICSSMIIKSLNKYKSDPNIMRKTQSKIFNSTFITENRLHDFLNTKNSFRLTKDQKFLPELKEKVIPNVINIIPAVINSVKRMSTATIDPDFFIKHSERIPDKSSLINFNMNPKLNKTVRGVWKKNFESLDRKKSNEENSSDMFENNLYYSNAFNKFHLKSTKIPKPDKIFNFQKGNLDKDPLAVKYNIRQEMKKRNLLAASRSDLKEIVKIKADLLEFYKGLHGNEMEDKIYPNNFHHAKNLSERNIEDFLDSNELNVLGYNGNYNRFSHNLRAHSININPANKAEDSIGRLNSTFLKKEMSNVLIQTEFPQKKQKQAKKIYKEIPMLQNVSEHLTENKNLKDKDELNRRMHNQDKKILHILKKINPNKEDLNKIFKKKNVKELFIE